MVAPAPACALVAAGALACLTLLTLFMFLCLSQDLLQCYSVKSNTQKNVHLNLVTEVSGVLEAGKVGGAWCLLACMAARNSTHL